MGEIGVLSNHDFRLLTWFRKLRNDVVHNWDFTVTDKHLQLFANPDHRRSDRFGALCATIVRDLWFAHPTVLLPLGTSGELVRLAKDVAAEGDKTDRIGEPMIRFTDEPVRPSE